jgi:uncharacterized membrane protein YdbT with pleckstrin-like domain
MSYARNLLSRGEEVVYESRQHWFAIIARTWLWILAAILALALTVWINSNPPVFDNDAVDGVLTVVAVIALLGAAGYVGFTLWDWRNQEWLITTRRVIRAECVLNKRVTDSSLEKINDAQLDQSMFGRIFGFGTLDILTAAEEFNAGSNIADFPMIADPIDFKKAMFDQKQMLENPDLAPRAGSDRVVVASESAAAPAPPPAAPAADPRPTSEELSATLERLAGLRDKGLITPDEFEAKKAQILERM